MIYDILEARLVAIGLVPGKTLFRETFPASVNVGVFTRVPLTGVEINHEMTDWYRTRMQVVVRHSDPVDGADMAKRVSSALTMLNSQTYPATAERGETMIRHFLPETIPVRFPALEGNGFEWATYFIAAFGMRAA